MDRGCFIFNRIINWEGRNEYKNFPHNIKATGVAAIGMPFLRACQIIRSWGSGPAGSKAKHVLRIAHITDIHLALYEKITDQFTSALQHIQNLNPRPMSSSTPATHYDPLDMIKI